MNTKHLVAGRFELQDLLGRGGMGEVYRAVDTQTGETVAVKALNPDVLTNDPNLLERFVREGDALRRLNHPNIVHMVAAVEEQGRHYLVMEFVEGGSLRDLLNSRGSLPANEVVKIALEFADALTRAHHLKIIHRDLKPANVLLAKDGTPHLADFGIAHVQDSSQLTQSGVLIGTVDYLSPELCQGEPPNELSDIWAFGVMLFEMLSGKLPFEGKSMTAKITAILHQPILDLNLLAPDASDSLVDLVYRMLEKDSQQRIPSVRLVGAELEVILKGRESVTPSRARGEESRFETPTPSTSAPKHNLPIQTTQFVGREAELVELDRLLADPGVRLLSIVGVGGMGKTRLALEAGSRQLELFQHGVYFVALAGIQAVEDIVPATAQVLGFSFYEGREPRQQLLDYLREKKMLLIFDNFEHLLACPEPGRGGGVSLVTDILRAASHVIALSTTRVRLGVPEEHIYQLSGMGFPEWETPADALEYSAVKLFLQSARRVRPGFELAADDLKYVARICRLVGGMPLGILLAAAWLEMLSPSEIAAEMQNSLDFLATDLPGVDERQRNIRAVLDYSWNSLSEQERNIFQQLSIFRGGFTREAVQAVTGASLRDLMGLVNKSLLTRTPSGRYETHEFLRQYGAEKLSNLPETEQATRDRHCACFAEFLCQREAGLHGKDQQPILAEIGTEVDNIRVGWDWAVAQTNVKWIDDYLESLGELYQIRGWHQEGTTLLAKAAQNLSNAQIGVADRTSQLVLGKILMRQGRLSETFDIVTHIDQTLQASIAIFRKIDAQRELAYALCYDGGCERSYGESRDEPIKEGLQIFNTLNDQRGMALALRGLAWIALHGGDYPLAKQRSRDSLDLYKALDDQKEIARSLHVLGYSTWILGQYQEAKQYHYEMLALCKEMNDQNGIARSLGDLGMDTVSWAESQESQEFFQASLAIYKEVGNLEGMADEFGDLGELATMQGDYAKAAQYAQESDALYLKIYNHPEAFTRRVLGNAARGLGNLQQARYYLFQALDLAAKAKRMGHIFLAFHGIAMLLAAEGDSKRAVELLIMTLNHKGSWQMAKDHAAWFIAGLEAKLPPEVVKAAQERGRSRDLETTVQELLVELGGNP